MRLLIAGSTAVLLALAACQGRAAKAPGANVETGATGSADSAVTPPTTPDTSAITPDTSARKDTSKAGGMGKDSTKKP